MELVIVESPTKAKTLNRFLGKDYEVAASMGHIRDIPSNKMNIDIEKDFEPVYELVDGKEKLVRELTRYAQKADTIYIATDPDREGEAIGYHVQYLLEKSLKKKKPFKRITFHQITKAAVEDAIKHASKIDEKLVDAQQARRILDRLVGYSLSPVLWRKVRRGLSAGRVQSVALRLVVEREREIEAFKPQEYWEINTLVSKQGSSKKDDQFWTKLFKIESKAIETKKGDKRNFSVNSSEVAIPIVEDLKAATYAISESVKKERKLSPKPPYTTSTLQQAAANSLGWTSKRTMQIAQQLYEEGLITYHRTDSMHLANEALEMVRSFIAKEYEPAYLPSKPRHYKTKSKSAQEAHEAIRPTDVTVKPTGSSKLNPTQAKLYALIWKRFVSCQMNDAVVDATTITVEAKSKRRYELKATGSIMKFPGWKTLYAKSTDQDQLLPDVNKGDPLDYKDIQSDQKFTQPPARYNDASLIKTLEELGIGRPSTYAPTISTLLARGYMERVDRRFQPSAVGMTVTDFLVKNFPEILDYSFTAEMEDDLDKIAEGKKDWVPMMKQFWQPFQGKIKKVTDTAERVQVPAEKTGEMCPKCGKTDKGEQVIRTGRYGKFISCSRFPDCDFTARFEEKAGEAKCPKCEKGDVLVKRTRKGRTFYGCSRYPECDWASWNDPRKESSKEES